MEIVEHVLVLAHLIGMACIVGGWISLRVRSVESGPGLAVVVWGARLQLLTGLALVGLLEALDKDVDHAKVGMKLAIALAVVACAEMASARSRRADAQSPARLIDAAGALAVVNTAIAVLL